MECNHLKDDFMLADTQGSDSLGYKNFQDFARTLSYASDV